MIGSNNSFFRFVLDNKIHKSWHIFFIKNYKIIKEINSYLETETAYAPNKLDIYKVFQTDYNKIKVIFLGQDPYHTPNVANGLSFCVNKNNKIPPSLLNIYKELNIEYPNKYIFNHGDISRWFYEENILLLNCALTTLIHKPQSHILLWNNFTNKVIKFLAHRKDIIFLLLGNFAKKYKNMLDNNIIVEGVHPSPLSAYSGFFNSDIFKKIDNILFNIGSTNIDWRI